MTEAQFNAFLSVCAWICAAGALLNLFLIKRRRTSAIMLSSAFVALAAVLWMLRAQASQSVIGLLAIVVLALLIGDFVMRTRNRESRR